MWGVNVCNYVVGHIPLKRNPSNFIGWSRALVLNYILYNSVYIC